MQQEFSIEIKKPLELTNIKQVIALVHSKFKSSVRLKILKQLSKHCF